MDGTLTNAMHDFPAIKRELGLPLELDILSGLSLLEETERKEKHKRLDQMEMDIARKATPAPGVTRLLHSLTENQIRLGILTRNNHKNTIVTLEASGLLPFFNLDHIITRDSAAPKPDPEGLLRLKSTWRCSSDEMIMIGDYIYDLQVGKAANTETIYIDPSGEFIYREQATYCVQQMDHILALDLH